MRELKLNEVEIISGASSVIAGAIKELVVFIGSSFFGDKYTKEDLSYLGEGYGFMFEGDFDKANDIISNFMKKYDIPPVISVPFF